VTIVCCGFISNVAELHKHRVLCGLTPTVRQPVIGKMPEYLELTSLPQRDRTSSTLQLRGKRGIFALLTFIVQ
jgi:hypothetical protein